MFRVWHATAFLLLFGAGMPALAQQPAVLTDPRDKDAVRPGPGIEPGFYDPATRRFTPGVPPPQAATPLSPVSGTFTVDLDFKFDNAIGALDTIQCVITIAFGNFVHDQFYSNHFARGGANFAAGKPYTEITVPYAYTPNSDKAGKVVTISCDATSDDGVYHVVEQYLSDGPVPNGDETFTATVRF